VSSTNTLTIGIHFDLICPWCFIGKRQLDLARDRFARMYPEVTVQPAWYPVQLLPDVPEQGLPFDEFYERRLGSPEAVRLRRQQIAQVARSVALDLDLTGIKRMPNTARAHELLRQVATLGDTTLYETLLERLFAGYFQRGEDIGDATALRALAVEAGVPSDRLADPTQADACATQVEPPIAGVPHFVFNGGRPLRGAQDAGLLLLAMSQAARTPLTASAA
jgi:predicted DsbA family dithiol-disulfide isomerase